MATKTSTVDLSVDNQLLKIIEQKQVTNFDWSNDISPILPPPTDNPHLTPNLKQLKALTLTDDSLRDGLGGIRIVPKVKDAINYIQKVDEFGVEKEIISIFSGADSSTAHFTDEILQYFAENELSVQPAITIPAIDIALEWAKHCKKIYPRLLLIPFIGTAPTRLLAENWTEEIVIEKIYQSISQAHKFGFELSCVVEHATQTPPEFLKKVLTAQIEASEGSLKGIALADTIGCGTPPAIARLFSFGRNLLSKLKASHIPLELHAHNDTGLAAINSVSAVCAGAKSVHVVPRGIGERAGNTSLEEIVLIFNRFYEQADIACPWNLKKLDDLLEAFHCMSKLPEPMCGVLGKNANQTGYGTHAAALEKLDSLKLAADKKISLLQQQLAEMTGIQKKIDGMSNNLYTAINLEAIGRKNVIIPGPQLGAKGVNYLARQYNLELSEKEISTIVKNLGKINHELTDQEFIALVNQIKKKS